MSKLLPLAALLALAALAAGSASAATPARTIIAKLTAIRAANGLPARIVENRGWSRKCRLHDAYLHRNRLFGHEENPALPGYTEGGNWAGTHAVLHTSTSSSGTWDFGNPFGHAPIHLLQLLDPRLASMGVDESLFGDGALLCMTTFPGYSREGERNRIYTYPGDGTRYWPASETVRELPFTPNPSVGIPEGTATGQYLYVLADGPWARAGDVELAAARLVGPGGPVRVRTVDSRTPTVGGYMLGRHALVIPVRPLREAAAYTATVAIRGGGVTLTKRWRFTTAVTNAASVDFEPVDATHGRFAVASAAPRPRLTVQVKGVFRAVPLRQSGEGYASPVVELPRGTFRECLSSGGGSTGYTLVAECRTWRYWSEPA